MKKNRLFKLLSIALIVVFVTSLVSTVNVLADDSTPPPATEEPTEVATGEPVETATQEVINDAPTTEIESTPTSQPEVDSVETPEVDTPAEVIESAPQGVDVVVLDENGEALPLATEEAAEIMMSGDPMWCPDGVTPGTDTLNECTPAYADFAGLITDLTNGGFAGSGTIYVSYDYALSEGEIYIDQTNGSLSSLANLVIQGGWDFGNDGMYNNDPTSQSTLDGTWLFINNWVGNVAINNLFVNNSTYEGLVVFTDGDVTLDQVDVNNSNQTGAYIVATGDVEVTNSSFTDNGDEGYFDATDQVYEAGDGLYVDTNGDVTLSNVYSADNGGNGAAIFGNDVEISESTFEDNGWGENDGYGAYWNYDEYTDPDTYAYSEEINGGNGLTIEASGDVTLADLLVYGNAGDGADIGADNDISITNSVFTYNGGLGSLYVSNSFYEDGTQIEALFDLEYEAGSGLIADAGGDITLIDVVASQNALDGADLESENGDVLITSGSVFEYNGEGGDLFDCGCGYEMMQDYLDDFCDFTGGFGNTMFNPCEDSGYIEVQGPVFEYEVHAYGDIDENYQTDYNIWQAGGSGLDIEAGAGFVTLDDVAVNNNTGEGAYIYAGDDVTITDSNFDENGSLGYLSVGECFASGMQECVETDGEPVSELYAGYLSVEHGDGLHVDSDGDITLQNVSASYNTDDGALLHGAETVSVENGDFSYNAQPIYIGGPEGLFGSFLEDELGMSGSLFVPASELYLDFSYIDAGDGDGSIDLYMELESGSGLEVEAGSNAELTNVFAIYNAGDGAELDADAGITITDGNFSGNGFGSNGYMNYEIFSEDGYEGEEAGSYMSNGNGLYLDSDGEITLTDVTANGNALYGAEIYTDSNVFIEDSQFSGNGEDGYASYEYYNSLGYYDQGLGQFIVIEEESESGEWYGSGLYIEAGGNITLKDVDANGNYQDGAELYSDGGDIQVICGNYNVNGEYGIYAEDASSLELAGPVIVGNGNSPDEYFFGGTVILSDEGCVPPAPPKDDSKEKLEGSSICEGTTTATFLLPNGDFVVFPCPINDFAVVEPLIEKDLPAALGDGQKFRSGLTTKVVRDGAEVEELEKPVVISFLIPKDAKDLPLRILCWDGTEWINLGGTISADGLYFEVSTNMVGNFVLVSE